MRLFIHWAKFISAGGRMAGRWAAAVFISVSFFNVSLDAFNAEIDSFVNRCVVYESQNNWSQKAAEPP